MAPHMQELTTQATRSVSDVVKRILIPLTPTSPPGLVQADTVDPWSKAGKYALGWTYFAAALSGCIFVVRMWHFWQDKIRQAIYKQQIETHYQETYNVDSNFVQAAIRTGMAQEFFPDGNPMGEKFRPKAHFSSIGFVNDTLALFRWVFYRSVPDIVIGKHRFTFSSLSVLATTFVAFAFVTLYTFLQQPLYWESIRFGAPPVAIRSGMLSVALTPWIIATGMKTNILTMLLGIGPERLNVFHRWLSYLCLFLSLIHMIPFYVQPVWEDNGLSVWGSTFPPSKGIIYGTGIACIVPLLWLNVFSLPWIRRVAYEAFVILHVPVGILYVGVLFWHTANRLLTWDYLYATCAIWGVCNLLRVFKLNWAKPGRMSFMVGDEAAITLMAENAIKVTIPTQMRWKPGQYVYLRMPGISFFDNHPFTISSLCSEDFPSEYGENYRDCILLFKAYGGFTRKVLDTAIEKGPFHTYRAFLDGPYGGMRRDLAAFDTCILIAGGSGITSLISQLLNLVKRMRDGKAITRKVVVVWAMKKFEDMDWFREELRICRESAPPESVSCKFFVTTAVRNRQGQQMTAPINGSNTRALTHKLHDKLDGFVAGIASKRNSAFIQAEAMGDPERERELREENEDRITALPQQKYLQPHQYPPPPPLPHPSSNESPMSQGALPEDNLGNLNENGYPEDKKQHDTPLEEPEPQAQPQPQPIAVPELAHLYNSGIPAGGPSDRPVSTFGPPAGFDFGFPQTPTEFQKNLMRSAFPMPHQITEDGWTIEYGRPDLGYMLKQWATGGPEGRGILGRRTAVFVCGPPGMRVGVANTVAKLQAEIWGDDELEEIFLHTENYAL